MTLHVKLYYQEIGDNESELRKGICREAGRNRKEKKRRVTESVWGQGDRDGEKKMGREMPNKYNEQMEREIESEIERERNVESLETNCVIEPKMLYIILTQTTGTFDCNSLVHHPRLKI